MRNAGSLVCSDSQLGLEFQFEAAQDLPTTLDISALDLSPMDWHFSTAAEFAAQFNPGAFSNDR
jgi:hypothetical protein